MSILITGGAGFVGSHLIERLLRESNEHIVCIDNFNDYYDPALKRANVAGFKNHPRVTLLEQSFCDQSATRRVFAEHQIERVVHLGAYAGVRPSVARPLVYEENNVRGTLVLLEAAREFPVKRFLLISSSTVYGRGAGVPFDEDQPLGVPLSPYGATKRAAELLGLTYVDLHQVPVVCLRPFSVYGPRLRPDLAMTIFTESILTGRALPLFGDGSIRRDFTHVDDINSGLIAALTADSAVGQAINLGHSEPIEIREVISLLEKALGRKANIERRPPVPEDMPITYANLAKAERILGYKPKMPFAAGVAQFVEWFCSARASLVG
jgi:UDP-glucuronate 4-epimerase